MSDFEYAIIGGGVHGTHIANKLISDGDLDVSELAVFDPEGYGEVFDQRTSDSGTEYLRSPEVRHTGRDPFDLKSYVEARNREAELTSDKDKALRPSTELFLDHIDYVVDSNSLEESLIEEYVTELREDDSLIVETEDDVYTAEYGVMAIGTGEPNYPGFAEQAPDSAPISHIFDNGFRSEDTQRYDGETVIVGGSITAGQLSGLLSRKCEGGVTMMSRSPIELELVEAEPEWINWSHIEDELHNLETEERHQRIQEERYDGSMPEYVWNDLKDCLDEGNLRIWHDEVSELEYDGEAIDIRTEKERKIKDAQVVLATGFESIYEHPFVEDTSENLNLATTENIDMPILNDSNLRWKHEDGRDSRLQVSGKLAEGTVGLFAGNIAGARRAAERITEDERTQRRNIQKVTNR
jgi:hypothetical protein